MLSARWAALAGGVLAAVTSAGCLGVEGDVLSLRQPPDLLQPADLEAPEPDLPPRCSMQVLDTRQCTDLTMWKMKAEDACRVLGQPLLSRIFLEAPCAFGPMGPAGAFVIRFECCKPPLPFLCSGRVQGDLTSCKDALVWQQSAALDCTSRGERLEALTFGESCDMGRYRHVRYQCCSQQPEARPKLGDGAAARSGTPSGGPVEITTGNRGGAPGPALAEAPDTKTHDPAHQPGPRRAAFTEGP